ncbi:hypothetical protein OH77DRAFT_227111 [Trametes cingulata]|nr:hypothetical protein OH77DRAFT_227111 [Trametes cingulata]
MSSSSGNAPPGGRLPFDPSLLQPIVRSKRTPMACLECRRRQVKCSGTTPRCERCQKKGIECTYMPLSEQRSLTGGSISRSGTPQAAHGASAQAPPNAQQQQGSRLAYQAQWAQGAQGVQGYPAGTTYATPQGWRAPTSTQGGAASQYPQQAGQTAQGYANVPTGYPQGYAQQATYAQAQGVPDGSEMYAQAYAGVTAQQGYATGTYNAYGQVVPNTDPRYAYQAAQMAGASGEQQVAAYAGQYAQQMYYDQATGQMISADAAAAQQWAGSAQGYQGQGYPGQSQQ